MFAGNKVSVFSGRRQNDKRDIMSHKSPACTVALSSDTGIFNLLITLCLI